MEKTKERKEYELPPFYEQYKPYYSYELERFASFPLVFSYRRIHSEDPKDALRPNPRDNPMLPGDISMQNWTWGNDYRPGTAEDNFIYTRNQLQELGQLEPGGWLGGLRRKLCGEGKNPPSAFSTGWCGGLPTRNWGMGSKNRIRIISF